MNQTMGDWQPLVKQAAGCLASAWARLAAEVGEQEAIRVLECFWKQAIPEPIIKDGFARKGLYTKLN